MTLMQRAALYFTAAALGGMAVVLTVWALGADRLGRPVRGVDQAGFGEGLSSTGRWSGAGSGD